MPSSNRLRTGLIGAAIQASKSPAMHVEEGRELGLDISYELLDLDLVAGHEDALPRLLDMAEREGFAGLNITHPCKQSVIQHLTRLSPDAEALGAVNTVVFRDGERLGHNTDWTGFAQSMAQSLPNAKLDQVLLLGAGGAGAAVAYALIRSGAGHIIIHDIDAARRDELIARLAQSRANTKLSASGNVAADLATCDGSVNCTPMGMRKYPGTPIPEKLLRENLWVADIVYFPLETELLKAARARGCPTLDGGGMAVFQAAEAFRLFTRRTPDAARMQRKFRDMVKLGAPV